MVGGIEGKLCTIVHQKEDGVELSIADIVDLISGLSRPLAAKSISH